jgi:hypothetical protein
MGKRSCTSNLIELEYEEGVALRSSKRRALQVASSNIAAISLLTLRREPPTALPEDTKPLFPLQPQRQAKAVNYSVSSITDDEDENGKKQGVFPKKRPDVFRVGPPLTQLALRKPMLPTGVGTRRREAPNHRKLPFGRPLPPAPLLPYLLMSRRVIPLTNKS